MQTLYNLVPTNTDDAKGLQVEFAAMLKDLNNKKGVVSFLIIQILVLASDLANLWQIFKPTEFTNRFWLAKNLPVTGPGNIPSWIVTLQDVSIAMAICQDPAVKALWDKTNLRFYNAL